MSRRTELKGQAQVLRARIDADQRRARGARRVLSRDARSSLAIPAALVTGLAIGRLAPVAARLPVMAMAIAKRMAIVRAVRTVKDIMDV